MALPGWRRSTKAWTGPDVEVFGRIVLVPSGS